MFSSRRNRGFFIDFDNGLVLSTQFGERNYCQNYDNHKSVLYCNNCDNPLYSVSSKDVEIAIFIEDDKGGVKKWMTQKILGDLGDDVKGYVGLAEWLEILEKVKNWKPENE